MLSSLWLFLIRNNRNTEAFFPTYFVRLTMPLGVRERREIYIYSFMHIWKISCHSPESYYRYSVSRMKFQHPYQINGWFIFHELKNVVLGHEWKGFDNAKEPYFLPAAEMWIPWYINKNHWHRKPNNVHYNF